MKIDHNVPLPFLTVKVEKDVPIPLKRGSRVVPLEFQKMAVGDSLWVHRDKIAIVRNWCHRFFGKGGYLTLKDGEGYRVWRIK